jgi:molybdate transport repressor ModE-like protein
MPLDQKRLRSLSAIARNGSFGEAARALGVSQPALSTSIALLEQTVGGAVLIRDRKGARLTPLGEILLQHARALEHLLDRAAAEARLFQADVRGPLVIGASPIAAASAVPKVILRMKKAMPRLAVSIIEGVDDDLIARLATGEIDFVVSPSSGGHLPPDIEEIPLIRGPTTVIMRPSNPLAGRRAVKFGRLAIAEWVLPIPGSALHRRIEALFLLAGVPLPAHAIATNSISAIKALVGQSDRVSIMARAMAEPEIASGRLVALPIADERFQQTLVLKRWLHRPASPIATQFQKIILEMTAGSRR